MRIYGFKGLEDKKKYTFIKSDIEALYPSITKKLLMKAINYGKTVTRIEDKEIDIILHARRAVLEDGDEVWIKKENPELMSLLLFLMGQRCRSSLDFTCCTSWRRS